MLKLSDLKFLTTAVAKKDFVEELCHFHLKKHAYQTEEGKLMCMGYAFDGMMSAGSPLDDVNVDVHPHASTFIKAVEACGDDEDIKSETTLTPAGKLRVKAGKFRAFVKCLPPEKNQYDVPMPQGEDVIITEEILDSFKVLEPLMGIDASRPWAMGVMLYGKTTCATNNIIIGEYYHGGDFPFKIIVPADFVKAVVKINKVPIRAQATKTSLTFHFENGKWLRTQLVVGEFPDVSGILHEYPTDEETKIVVNSDFFPSLERLRPFLDDYGRVYIYPDRLATSTTDEDGATIENETGIKSVALFHLEQLKLLESVSLVFDFSPYPAPCPWFGRHENQGKKVRGIIMGQRITTPLEDDRINAS